MNDQNAKAADVDEKQETESPRLTIEVPTDLKAGLPPWLPPCACKNCCQGGGCADGS